ncbi:hypothetical protein Mgra_00004292 [Meloidogyne graminicola]|uniref:Metallo-beta-lactamase domain-containing protein 1 n=1 Tax=Meloidogyne graminicola TaxID=189291 RepID=A0A8S9ZSZ5_9BILA|nr:hypothetical protein Mgra_00004292 [Meloidogyne graminicola]
MTLNDEMDDQKNIYIYNTYMMNSDINSLNKTIIFNDLNFKISQIIVGNVQLTLHPLKENLPSCLNNFDFVGANCSVTLIEKINDSFKMLVDCASPFEKDELFKALNINGINSPTLITHLVISHWHIDHCGLINLFQNAKLIIPENIGSKNFKELFKIPNNINFFKYSGHSCADLVVSIILDKNNLNIFGIENIENYLVNESKVKTNFNILIVGDIFEFENDWLGNEMWKSSSLLPDKQSLARWLCWNKSDFIIPGHGPGFLTNKREPPSQSPIFGKIFFDSSNNNQYSLKTNTKLTQIEEILTFYVDGNSYSINLIKSNDLNILINTGGKEQRNDLIKALNLRNISLF